jgi:hypothetical protein
MTPRLFALTFALLTLAACDTRMPQTAAHPEGITSTAVSRDCTNADGQTCSGKEEHSFWHDAMPWNWF